MGDGPNASYNPKQNFNRQQCLLVLETNQVGVRQTNRQIGEVFHITPHPEL
jgi:hypothetical protein